MKNLLRRIVAVLLTVCMLSAFVAAGAVPAEYPKKLLRTVSLSETILQGDYFYLANDSVCLDEDAETTYLFTVGRGGNTDDSAEVTVLFRDITACYGENYTAAESGGDEATVPDGHMSYVEILADADSYEEYPLLSEEDAEAYLLESIDEVEDYLEEQLSSDESDDISDAETDAAAVIGAYAGNPLAEAHAKSAGRTLNRIPASEKTDMILVNTDTGESSGGETERDPDTLTNSFSADSAETERDMSVSDTDAAIPPAQITLSFAPGEQTKTIEITPRYSSEAQGDAMFMMALSDPSEGTELSSRNSIMVTIADTDEADPAVLSFCDNDIYADSESAFVTVSRSGAINKMISAYIFTEELDAEGYTDFSPIGARLVFPFGVKSRTVEIPVNHIRDAEVSFRVLLAAESDCCIDENAAAVTITLAPYEQTDNEEETFGIQSVTAQKAPNALGASAGNGTGVEKNATAGNDAVNLSKVSIAGSGFYSGNGNVSLTTHGIDDNIVSAVTLDPGTDIACYSYAYDGYLVRWQLDEGFWFPDYEVFLDGKNSDDPTGKRSQMFRITDDDGYDDLCWTPLYFGVPSVYDTRLGMQTFGGSGNDLYIYDIIPIRREFHVGVLPAVSLPFRNVSEVESSAYTAVTINDQKSSALEGIYTSKYVGDSVSITATDANHYLTLSGVELCTKDGDDIRVLAYLPNSNPASDTFTLDLDQDFIDIYGSNFIYEAKQNIYTESEIGNAYALTGKFYLRPCFNYRDVSLNIQEDADGRGSFSEFPYPGLQYGWHLGDVVNLSGSMKPQFAASADVTAYAFTMQKNVQTEPVSGSILFGSSNSARLQLTSETVSLRPVTTERNNALVVTVSKADFDKFDLTQGIFAAGNDYISYNAATQQYEITVVPEGSLSNGQLCSLTAVPASENAVPVWSEFGNNCAYSGTTFYHMAGSKATENVVCLTIAEIGITKRSLQGYLFYSNINVNTARSASATFPASGQPIAAGGESAIAYADGFFETEPFTVLHGTYLRYLTASGGNVRLGDIYIPSGEGTLSAGMITVPAQTSAGVTVNRVSAEQNGYYLVQTIPISGIATTLRASVTDNVDYVIGNETLTEHISAVRFVVLDGKTFERKAEYAAQKSDNYEEDPVWIANTGLLTPDMSTDYAAGDYLYVEIESDRQLSSFEGADEQESGTFSGITYIPQYCGYTFTSTDSYEPVLMEIAIPLTAENILTGDFKSFYSVEESANRRKFVSLPFIGALDTQISAARTTKDNIPYDPMREDNYNKAGSYGSKTSHSSQNPAINFSVTVEARPNGVTRLKMGATVTFSNSTEEQISQSRATKFSSVTGALAQYFENPNLSDADQGFEDDKDLIYRGAHGREAQLMRGSKNYLQSVYGGTSMTFSIQFGIYVDFGLVSDNDSAIGAHFILIGVGGYLGFAGSIGYTQYFIIPMIIVPGYVGFTGSLAVIGSIGASGDPNNALNYDEQDHSFIVNDFFGRCEASLNGIISLTGFLGIGIRGISSIRGTATVTFSVGMDSMYPEVYENCPSWGLDLSLALGMVIDFAIFSLPFRLVGWDLWQDGFYAYLTEFNENGTVQGTNAEENSFVLGYNYQARTMGSTFTGGYNGRAVPMSTFAPDSFTADTVIAENIYAHPSTKLLALEDGKVLMIFLDDDPEKADDQITSLYYAVYDGQYWSDPEVVQKDGTGDFSPNLTDCGDRVLISWVSAPDDSAETDIDRLMDLEVYSVFFDKATESIAGEPVRLTDDIFYDSEPIGVYDIESDSIALYYTKNAPEMEQDEQGEWQVSPEVSLLDVSNSLSSMTYSMICYRLYENGEWIDYYYDGEYTPEQTDMILTKGERYLDTEIQINTPSGVNTDPLITDFCAAPGYNGLAVFAYSVDLDNDFETDNDRELYLQVYSFDEHKVYHPARLTNNDASDTQPQLVRSADTTRLFWLAGNESIYYSNVTDILRYGLNPDGSLRSFAEAEQAAAEKQSDCDIQYHKIDMRQKGISYETGSAVTDYVALAGTDGSLYVLWGNGDYSAPAESEDPDIYVNREIYAVGMVTDVRGIAWSDPVKLTNSGTVNDDIAAVIDSNGRLMVAVTRYEMIYHSDAGDDVLPLSLSPMQLVTVSLANVGSVEVTGIDFSNRVPLSGEDVTVTVTVKNTGLTTASGYSLNLSELSEDGTVSDVFETVSDTEPLLPGAERNILYQWTVPEQFDDTSLLASVRETGYSNTARFTSSPLKAQPLYSLELLNGYQNGDVFCVDYSILNEGNVPSFDGDEIALTFINLYGHSGTDFGFVSGSDEIVGRSGPLKLEAEERAEGTILLSLPKHAFDLYGYVDLAGCVNTGKGEKISNSDEIIVAQTAPVGLTIESGNSVTVRGSRKLTVSFDAGHLKQPSEIVYSVGDTSLAYINGDTVTALADGETEITATLLPYGTSSVVPLITKVYDEEEPEEPQEPTEDAPVFPFADVTENDYYFNAVKWAVKNGITTGTDQTHFSPEGPATRAQIVTFLYRSYLNTHGKSNAADSADKSCRFTDVTGSAYYYDAVLWAVANGITNGVSDTEFNPNGYATRAQMVTFLYRFSKAFNIKSSNAAESCSFADVDISAYYYDAVLWAIANGITNGVSDTKFSPNTVVSRAQAVTFLHRFEQ